MEIIAIIGSRTTNKDTTERCKALVQSVFFKINKPNQIVMSGGAFSGADYWAKYTAHQLGFRYIEAPANWRNTFKGQFDKYAGLFRNTTIAMVCDRAVAIWDGKSIGTKHCLQE